MTIANMDVQVKKIMSQTSVESFHGGRAGKRITAAGAMSISAERGHDHPRHDARIVLLGDAFGASRDGLWSA